MIEKLVSEQEWILCEKQRQIGSEKSREKISVVFAVIFEELSFQHKNISVFIDSDRKSHRKHFLNNFRQGFSKQEESN